MKNNLIMFDCFGVLFNEITPPWFNSHFDKSIADNLKDEYFNKADYGELTMEEIAVLIDKRFGLDAQTTLDEWHNLICPKTDTIMLLEKVSQINHTVLASNIPKGFLKEVFAKRDLTKYFENIFQSCELQRIKPHKDFYQAILNATGTNFDKIVMIDDNPKNLECLSELGIVPVLFTSATALETELKKLNVI